MNILIIDDSSTTRRMLKNIIEKTLVGNVYEADCGNAGLKKLTLMDVNLILLDWNMPEMDGLTVLKNIRSNSKNDKIKVVMCTTEATKERILEAIKFGANDYIVKPFTPNGLSQKLNNLGLK